MKKIYSQRGWTKFGVIGVMFSAAIGFYGFDALLANIPISTKISVPLILVSIFLLPLTFCVNLLSKLWELKEQDNLSRAEQRRLKPMIDGKIRQLHIAIIYYVMSAVMSATFLVFSENDSELFRVVLKLTGGLLGISVFSVPLIFLELNAISDFKSKLKRRIESKKRQESTLARLCSKDK